MLAVIAPPGFWDTPKSAQVVSDLFGISLESFFSHCRPTTFEDTRSWDQALTVIAVGRESARQLGIPNLTEDVTRGLWWGAGARWRRDSQDFFYAGVQEFCMNQRGRLIPEIILNCPTLRPWDFLPIAQAELAASLCPGSPRLGALAILLSSELRSRSECRLLELAKLYTDRKEGTPWDAPLADLVPILCQDRGLIALAKHWGFSAKSVEKRLRELPCLELPDVGATARYFERGLL